MTEGIRGDTKIITNQFMESVDGPSRIKLPDNVKDEQPKILTLSVGEADRTTDVNKEGPKALTFAVGEDGSIIQTENPKIIDLKEIAKKILEEIVNKKTATDVAFGKVEEGKIENTNPDQAKIENAKIEESKKENTQEGKIEG